MYFAVLIYFLNQSLDTKATINIIPEFITF